IFSYIQVGIPLKKNWGLSFGLRPVSRISYKINKAELLSGSGGPVDSMITQFNGSGGSFLPTIGTGFSIGRLSAGVNMGYLFGRREISTRRAFINDSVSYYASNSANNSSFGGLFFNAGLQYRIDLKNNKFLRLGLAGNWEQTLSGTRDVLRQTYTLGASGETLQIDSVFAQNDIAGEVVYPASYTAGFLFGDDAKDLKFGVDYTTSKWSNYRYFGQKDSVQNSWKLAAGGQYRPKPGKGYFSNVAYRFGFSFGQDYIRVNDDLPTFGLSVGAALPIRINRTALNQINAVNLSFEFNKRGNQQNVLRENIYRLSLGFNLTDLWFIKRKYD
ncbi:MAG: hypothetical protein V4676_05595, partial [Bacteroidota bacterium]